MLHDADARALILSEHHVRKLSRNLTFRFERREHQLTGEGKGHRLRPALPTVFPYYGCLLPHGLRSTYTVCMDSFQAGHPR